jgi:hypothetical protein
VILSFNEFFTLRRYPSNLLLDPSEIMLDVSSLDHVVSNDVEFPINKKWGASFWTQFRMLCWRNTKQSKWRIFDDCTVAHTLIVCCAFCIIYYQIPHTIDSLRNRMGSVRITLKLNSKNRKNARNQSLGEDLKGCQSAGFYRWWPDTVKVALP